MYQMQPRYAYVPINRCQHKQAPRYLIDLCTPVSDVSYRLRSAISHEVFVPRYRLSTYGRWAFSVARPAVWNSLPKDMRDPECSVDSYRQWLKTFYFCSTSVFSALEISYENALYKFAFNIDIVIDIAVVVIRFSKY